MIIADADFLSSFVKIKKIDLILKAFNVNKVIIPNDVLRELEKAPFFDVVVELIESKKIEVKNVNIKAASDELGIGEEACMTLAKQTGGTLLISDQSAMKHAGQRGITVLDVPAFLLYCKKKNILSKKDLLEVMRELKEKDYYGFSEEVKQWLLQ